VIGQAFDRTFAFLALLVLAPLFAGLAFAVRLTSPGPVFVRQVRVGLGGKPFEILKFRTMVDRADRMSADMSPDGDPHVTELGRFLRAWYLDALPQLVNVLKGDMSLVGPRPETPEYVALYSPLERRVLCVRPGLAGPSTLALMDEAAGLAGVDDPAEHDRTVLLHERVRMDLGYLEQKSLGYDLRLLVRQTVSILRRLDRQPTTAR
jgi:lipopolysaccharide/colanic/teichoic acid biosynthesis glycosyltransferase